MPAAKQPDVTVDGRPIEGRATCPRCRRRIVVPVTGEHATCPHCQSRLSLQGTL